MTSRYERNRAARNADNERRLMGQTLKAFHAMETAKPPTLAEIYRTHPRARCPWTCDFIDTPQLNRSAENDDQ